ncbi:MAG: HIT domain-containing protein [candidate division WOR-3 bacterium]
MKRLWAPWRVEYIRSPSRGCFLCEALREKDAERVFVLENGTKAFTIMNRYPYNNGHLLVAPIRHIGSIEELNDDEVLDIHRLILRAIKVMEVVIKPAGFNVGINQGSVAGAGLVDHIHVHLVPRWPGDTNFMPIIGETKVISEGLKETYNKIKKGLQEL